MEFIDIAIIDNVSVLVVYRELFGNQLGIFYIELVGARDGRRLLLLLLLVLLLLRLLWLLLIYVLLLTRVDGLGLVLGVRRLLLLVRLVVSRYVEVGRVLEGGLRLRLKYACVLVGWKVFEYVLGAWLQLLLVGALFSVETDQTAAVIVWAEHCILLLD